MSNYLSPTRGHHSRDLEYLENRHHFYSPTTQGGQPLLDSIEYGQPQGEDSDNGDNDPVIPGDNVMLLASEEHTPQDTMDILTEAFTAAFAAMQKGVIIQNEDYVNLQQLDLTQSQSVLQSTTIAITKQKNVAKEEAQIQEAIKSSEDSANTVDQVVFWVGIALMAVTVITSFFDLGLSDLLLPEEEEMIDMSMGEEMAENMGSKATELPDVQKSPNLSRADMEAPNEEGVPNYMSASREMFSDADPELNAASKEMGSEMEDLEGQAAKSGRNWNQTLRRLISRIASKAKGAPGSKIVSFGKFLAKLGLGAGMASPSLMRGLSKLAISSQLEQLAAAQYDAGKSTALQQSNNMYFQFVQQVVQRQGGIIEEEVNGASDVLATFSVIADAWKGIPMGLADAV
jgi:hypothetical protein